jgi:hypothetical protein
MWSIFTPNVDPKNQLSPDGCDGGLVALHVILWEAFFWFGCLSWWLGVPPCDALLNFVIYPNEYLIAIVACSLLLCILDPCVSCHKRQWLRNTISKYTNQVDQEWVELFLKLLYLGCCVLTFFLGVGVMLNVGWNLTLFTAMEYIRIDGLKPEQMLLLQCCRIVLNGLKSIVAGEILAQNAPPKWTTKNLSQKMKQRLRQKSRDAAATAVWYTTPLP